MYDTVDMICHKCEIVENYYDLDEAYDNNWFMTIENGQIIHICPHCLEKMK